MSFQEFVSSGFGLFKESDAKSIDEKTTIVKNGQEDDCTDTRQPTEEECRDFGREFDSRESLEKPTLLLVDERKRLLRMLEKSKEEIESLKTQNKDLKNENNYRNLMIKKMNSRTRKQNLHMQQERAKLEKMLKQNDCVDVMFCGP